MEDRITPALYLEMSDLDPPAYAAERVPEVLGRPGATRATWWENVHRDRTDLPRRLPEFGLLGVYEADATFTPPPAETLPGGVSGHHFRFYGRPGQGILSGKPTIGLSLVLISPREAEGAQRLRDWGDFVHIRHIAEVAVPGYTMITPYVNAAGADPLFMHFYEMDCDDPERAFKAMTPLVTERLGPPESEAWQRWANTPELRIMYVNTFRRIGVRDRDEP